MKIKTSELSGVALDWAVAKCEGVLCDYRHAGSRGLSNYSTDWSQGGPIIECEKIDCINDPNGKDVWLCVVWSKGVKVKQYAKTPLIAAMRCYVASRMGDEVAVPDELV